jgi:uncharacterized membrane protein
MAAMLAALTCVATMIIKIPSPLKGYVNIGDCVVLLAAWSLSPTYAFLSAGLGSALADLFSGYLIYAPATFVIKGAMTLIAYYVSRAVNKKGNAVSQIVGGVAAEVWMAVGYYVFEGILYGFAPSAVNIPANCVQGVAGLILGFALIKIFV